MELKSHHIALTLTLSLLAGTMLLSTLFGGSAVSLVFIFGFAAFSLLSVTRVSTFVHNHFKERIVRFCISFFAVFEGTFFTYFYCEFLKKTALTKTPSIAIFILFFCAIAGIVAMNVHSLTNATHFVAPFIIIFYLGLLATNLNLSNMRQIALSAESDIAHKGLAVVAVGVLFMVTPLLFMPILYHKIELKTVQNGIKSGLILGFVLVFGGILSGLLTLGQPLAAVLDFPFYYAASVATGGSLERFESLVSVVVILSGVIHVALCGLVIRSYE